MSEMAVMMPHSCLVLRPFFPCWLKMIPPAADGWMDKESKWGAREEGL